MDPDDLQQLIAERPDGALDHSLTTEQFDFCIRKAPGAAILNSRSSKRMSAKQFDECCRLNPASAIFSRRKLSLEQMEFCCQRAPAVILRNLSWDLPRRFLPRFKPTKAQIATCCRHAPAEALQLIAGKMEKGLLDECARAAPAAALQHATPLMDDALFTGCAKAAPLAAIRWGHGRLTDDDLVRHIAGRGVEIRHLLVSEPALVLRLSRLSDRLGQGIVAAVSEAIVMAM